MSTNIQKSPFLPKQRNFPNDNAQELGVELDKAYVDIALRVNDRTIGTFGVINPIITGEQWYFRGQPKKQQTLRRVFSIKSTDSIAHEINIPQTSGFTRIYGTFTDETNWYGLIAGSSVAIAGQVSFYLTNDNIMFLSGAGAPTVKKGIVVLEWLSTAATNS